MIKIARYLAPLVIISLMGAGSSYSQNCTACVIDLGCTISPAEPILCPDTLPTDTAQQYYETDVTFYIPVNFDITDPISATVTLNQIDIIGLTGLPAGMSWTSYDWTGNDTTSFYPPQNPPASERGCARICGTPLMPGNYIVTVSVKAYVDVGGNPYIQYPTFDVPLEILPSGSGNSVFTMNNSQGCDSITTSFAPILQSGGDPLITYLWDFGDGSPTTTQEFPDHTYVAPGYYVVSMTMNIYEYVLTDVSATATGCGWSGDIEEPFCFNNPDIYFNFNDSSSAFQSTTVDDSKTPSWSNLGQVIIGNDFSLEFWDEDLISAWDYLGIDFVNFPGAGIYTLTTSEIDAFATVIVQLDTSYTDVDTVHVYASPVLPPMTVVPNDSVCQGNTVLLTSGGGQFYQWYEDTTLLLGETDSSYLATQAGNYWVEVTSAAGCVAISDTQSVFIVSNPNVPTFFQNGGKLQSFSTSPNLQWHVDTDTIAGETGQVLYLTQGGTYFLTSTNAFGCVSSSDTLTINFVNAAPTAVDDNAETDSAVSVVIDVQANDFDPNNPNLTTTIISGPGNGTAILLNGDSIQYTPGAGFLGMDTIFYEVCDIGMPVLCDTAMVTILVSPVNSAPVAVDDNATTDSAVTIIIDVQANDFDPNNDSLTTVIVTGPSNGSVTLWNNDSIQYTPNIGFTGMDTLYYEVCDDGTPILCDTAMVTITVSSVVSPNDKPIAVDDNVTTDSAITVVIDVQANDFDPNNDSLTTTVISGPANGNATVLNDDSVQYAPNIGFKCIDTFIYQVCDDGVPILCDNAIVTITVSSAIVIPGVLENNDSKWNLLENHPNPFVEKTEIFFTSKDAGIIEFTIYNGMGELVYSREISAKKGMNAFEVALPGIAPGIYMYSIKQGDSRVTKRMIISQ